VTEHVVCNLCGADDTRLLFRRGDYRYWVDDVEWNVVECRRCGLGYVNPRPTEEEIGRYYAGGGYYDQRDAFVERYRRQARYLAGPPSRLLDIGAAGGQFLRVMRDLGWDVAGIEPFAGNGSEAALDISHARFPRESPYAPESFDVVTAWAVFEHLHDPLAAFRACADLLRPGGRLIIQVPSSRSLRVRVAHVDDTPRHLYLFSPKTLRRYAEAAGLEIERISDVTDLFSAGSGGSLRRLAARALGRTDRDLALLLRRPRSERFRRAPLFAGVAAAANVLDRVLLPTWLLRAAGLSGQIVAEFRKPVTAAVRRPDSAPAVEMTAR
jgi:SAM-dependent methyltransferase